MRSDLVVLPEPNIDNDLGLSCGVEPFCVDLALSALAKIHPSVDIRNHILGDPITVSWEADPNFLGAFKGVLPGHYRNNHHMFGHFMQDNLPAHKRGIFMAGDGVS